MLPVALLLLASPAMAPPPSPPPAPDAWVVTLDESVAEEPLTGRLILFFITERGRRWGRRAPMSGPFFSNPQPIASMSVEGWSPGDSVAFDGSAVVFPGALDDLEGPVRVQALLDRDQTERSHDEGPGNLFSEPMNVRLDPAVSDRTELRLTRRIEPRPLPAETAHLKWVELRSEQLSSFYGRDVAHRAGVALPKGYGDDPERRWPAIYVIPGYGGTHRGAVTYATVHATPGSEAVAPQAVYVVLDPESPLGHHGFVDSPNHGPRGTALVTELLPALETRFRLAPRPEARIVTGHSSGAWSSLWLQLNHPRTFGACWASAPDPVDFRAFQRTNLYEDENLFRDAAGRATPSYREQVDFDREVVRMTVRDEVHMERAIDPHGRSGQQWDAWEAMFSPRDPATGLPRPLVDDVTGRIDREVARHWSRFDIRRTLAENWERDGAVFTGRVRLACGTLDSFYLDRAVGLLAAQIEERGGHRGGPGYIRLVDGATHGNLTSRIFADWNEEMRAHLREHGLHE
jgi:hypothetical protein